MKLNKNFFFGITIVVLIVINIHHYLVPLFTNYSTDIVNIHPSSSLDSEQLINSFKNNETESNNLYTGKILEVSGVIKEISFLNNRNTIILQAANKNLGVICDIDKSQKDKFKSLKINQKVTVKGMCKGFLNDVILLNCYIDLKPNE